MQMIPILARMMRFPLKEEHSIGANEKALIFLTTSTLPMNRSYFGDKISSYFHRENMVRNSSAKSQE